MASAISEENSDGTKKFRLLDVFSSYKINFKVQEVLFSCLIYSLVVQKRSPIVFVSLTCPDTEVFENGCCNEEALDDE